MNSSGNIEVANSQIGHIFIVCLILIVGISYNLYSDPNALYAAFTPFHLDVMYGQILVISTFILAVLCGIRLFGFLRNPLIAQASDEGLYMRGIGIVPWDKVHKIWFGTFFEKPQGTLGTFMFVEFIHPIETKKLNLKTAGIYSEKATKSGRFTKIRYWLPFVLPHGKKQFIETANLYCPHNNWLE